MKEVLVRLMALCAVSAATQRMRLGPAIGNICSLCVVEALVELLAMAIGFMKG